MSPQELSFASANVSEELRLPLPAWRGPGGPDEELFRAARDVLCARAQAVGTKLFVSDSWTALEQINRRNLDTWRPLLHRNSSFPAVWVGALDCAGEVVGTQAALRVDCRQRSYGERLEDLSLFYDRPDDVPPGEACFVGGYSPVLTTRGIVAWLAAGWVHPNFRRRDADLFHVIGRAIRLVAWPLWNPSWWAGVVEPETCSKWSVERAGRRHLDDRPTILYQQRDVKRPPLHHMRISRSAFRLDLQDLVRAADELELNAR